MSNGPDRFIVCCLHDPTENDAYCSNAGIKPLQYFSGSFISHFVQWVSNAQFQALVPNVAELPRLQAMAWKNQCLPGIVQHFEILLFLSYKIVWHMNT